MWRVSHFCPFQMLLLLSAALTVFAHDGEHGPAESVSHTMVQPNAHSTPTKTMPIPAAGAVTVTPTTVHEPDGHDMSGHEGHNHDAMTTQGPMATTILPSSAFASSASLMGLIISIFL